MKIYRCIALLIHIALYQNLAMEPDHPPLLLGAKERGDAPLCTICLEPLSNDEHTLSCSHTFHHQCFSQWDTHRKNIQLPTLCPMCRTPLITETQHSDIEIPQTQDYEYEDENEPTLCYECCKPLLPCLTIFGCVLLVTSIYEISS
jgi:hypothetical protein